MFSNIRSVVGPIIRPIVRPIILLAMVCALTLSVASCGDPYDMYTSMKAKNGSCPAAQLSCEVRVAWIVIMPIPYTSCTCVPAGSSTQKLVGAKLQLLLPGDPVAQEIAGLIERSLSDIAAMDAEGKPRPLSTSGAIAEFRRLTLDKRVRAILNTYPDLAIYPRLSNGDLDAFSVYASIAAALDAEGL